MSGGLPPDLSQARSARENPFRVERVLAVRFRPLDTTWEAMFERLRALQFRAAIWGPQGSGKTTLLEDLSGRLTARGLTPRLLHLRRTSRPRAARLVFEFLETAGTGDVLLVDGVEQLGPVSWFRLRRRSLEHAGLIVTSHTSGRLPTLFACRTDASLLASLVAELVPGDIPRLREHLPALYAAHRGNLRLCLRALYDVYAGNPDGFAEDGEVLS